MQGEGRGSSHPAAWGQPPAPSPPVPAAAMLAVPLARFPLRTSLSPLGSGSTEISTALMQSLQHAQAGSVCSTRRARTGLSPVFLYLLAPKGTSRPSSLHDQPPQTLLQHSPDPSISPYPPSWAVWAAHALGRARSPTAGRCCWLAALGHQFAWIASFFWWFFFVFFFIFTWAASAFLPDGNTSSSGLQSAGHLKSVLSSPLGSFVSVASFPVSGGQ